MTRVWVLYSAILSAFLFSSSLAQAYEVDVTVVGSRVNQIDLEKEGFDYREGIRFWSGICEKAGLTYRISGDYEFETGLKKSRVYVVHRAEKLTKAKRNRLERLKKDGASIILVGMVGSKDSGGKDQVSLSQEWFELEDIRPYKPKDFAYFAVLGGTTVSTGSEPGFRFEFDWSVEQRIATTRHALAGNVDWSLNPHPKPGALSNNALMAARMVEGARLVWFGVGPETVISLDEQQSQIQASMMNLLRWAARRPVATPCYWPGCNPVAAVITADVEEQFTNGDGIALVCHKQNVRGSFFVVGNLAEEYPETVLALAANGSVGSHSISHQSFKALPLEDQVSELERARSSLEAMGVRPVAGFRPPMEEYDENTIRAVAATGLDFLYGNLLYDRAFPSIVQVDGTRIYQFPRVVDDDYNLVMVKGVKTAEEYLNGYMSEFERIRDMGAVFPFSFHTNYLALPENLDVMRSVIQAMKKGGAWIATFGEIVEWLEIRRAVQVNVKMGEDGTVALDVTNGSESALESLPILYFPTHDRARVKTVATPSVGVIVVAGSSAGSSIVKVSLAPGEAKRIILD